MGGSEDRPPKRLEKDGRPGLSLPHGPGGIRRGRAELLYSVIICEELARTNHTGLAAPLHSDVVVPYITEFGTEELKKKYLPGCCSGDLITAIAMTEPNTGSDLAAIRTTAVEEGDTVILKRPEDLYQQRHQLRFVGAGGPGPGSRKPL